MIIYSCLKIFHASWSREVTRQLPSSVYFDTRKTVFSFWTNSENSVPAEFTLLTPLADEEVGLTPTFSWTESSDADLYDEITYTLSYGTDPYELTDVTTQESSEDNFSLSFDGVDEFISVIDSDSKYVVFKKP